MLSKPPAAVKKLKNKIRMCRKVECSTCKKATWAGCGMHIDAALNGVKIEDRCDGYRIGKCPLADNTTSSDAKPSCTIE